MLHSDQVEELVCLIAVMDRPSLARSIRSYDAPFPIDFTPEFLASVSLERLRHIFLALCLQCQKLPHGAMSCEAEPALSAA